MVMLLEITSASDLFGLALFCELAEPANGGLDQHVSDGCSDQSFAVVCFVRPVSVISDWH